MSTQAEKQAVKDIKQELSLYGKYFLAFRTELNPIMKKLVSNQIKAQRLCVSSKQMIQ